MVEIHAEEELGSLTITLVKYSNRPVNSWDVAIADKNNSIKCKVEDLDNITETVDELIDEVKDR